MSIEVKKIYGVIASITESGVTTTKVIPLSLQKVDDVEVYYSEEHDQIIYSLGEHWYPDWSKVTFASENEDEAKLFYNGLAGGAALFATWMKYHGPKNCEIPRTS